MVRSLILMFLPLQQIVIRRLSPDEDYANIDMWTMRRDGRNQCNDPSLTTNPILNHALERRGTVHSA